MPIGPKPELVVTTPRASNAMMSALAGALLDRLITRAAVAIWGRRTVHLLVGETIRAGLVTSAPTRVRGRLQRMSFPVHLVGTRTLTPEERTADGKRRPIARLMQFCASVGPSWVFAQPN